jgi:hypothetical protein
MTASFFDSALGILKAVGPFILLLALAYAVLNSPKRSRAKDARGERAVRDLYTDQRAQRDNLPGDISGGPPARPT